MSLQGPAFSQRHPGLWKAFMRLLLPERTQGLLLGAQKRHGEQLRWPQDRRAEELRGQSTDRDSSPFSPPEASEEVAGQWLFRRFAEKFLSSFVTYGSSRMWFPSKTLLGSKSSHSRMLPTSL